MITFQQMPATRIVATPVALDKVAWPAETLVLRLARDEALVTPPVEPLQLDDPQALIVADGGFAAAWVPAAEAFALLERTCEWALPQPRPAFAQGAVAGVPVKLWLEAERVLFVVPGPYVHDFQARWQG